LLDVRDLHICKKPDKFGIKFWLLCDVNTKYVLNAIPYLGKDDSRPDNVQLGHHVTKELLKPYLLGGYNVTTDNFFYLTCSCEKFTAIKNEYCWYSQSKSNGIAKKFNKYSNTTTPI
jgi:hypothetical protein